MTYNSIKTIQGKKYLYRVTSYRDPAEPDKVKKIMEYVGPVHGYLYQTQKAVDTVINPASHPQEPQETTSHTFPIGKWVKAIRSPHRGRKTQAARTTPIDSRISYKWIQAGSFWGFLTGTKGKKGISKKSLASDYLQTMDWLKRFEINPTNFPRIVLRFGKLGHKRRRLDIGGFPLRPMRYRSAPYYEVSIPLNSLGKREQFRRHYRMALARAMLDTIEQEKPELYRELENYYKGMFEATDATYKAYIENTNLNWVSKKSRILALNWFRKIPEFKGKLWKGEDKGKTWRVEPEKLGLFEYGKRESWQDEFAVMTSEMFKSGGYYKVFRESFLNSKKAENSVNYETNRKLSKEDKFFKKKRVKTLLKLGSKQAATSLRQQKIARFSHFFPSKSRPRS